MEGTLGPGTVFAGYRIDGLAGRGGMGLVYRATQLALDRTVALKLVAPELAQDEAFRRRFKRESRLAASIDHPNAITVHEAGEEQGQLYISMRFVEGVDFGTLIAREGPISPRRAARIVAQVAAALDAAHARGLVHRDIKPGNVLIERRDGEEHAYLTDFGLTKDMSDQSEITGTGQWVGTLDYASPEQIAGGSVDARADTYALGCLLYKALCGDAPFSGRENVAKVYAHMNEPPPTLSGRAPELPAALEDVVRRALAKDPAERFPSAGDLGRATMAAAEGLTPSQPERSVATGEAAPTEPVATEPLTPPTAVPPTTPATAAVPPSTPATVAVPGAPATQPLGGTDTVRPERPAAPRRLVLGAVALGVAALAVLVVMLTGGGEPNALEANSFGTSTIGVGEGPSGMATGANGVWVGVEEEEEPAVKRIDPDSGDVTASIPVTAGAGGALAVGEGSVWLRSDGDTITRIDPGSERVVGNPIDVPVDSSGGVAVGEGFVWTSNPIDGSVSRIDPETDETRDFEASGVGNAIAAGEGSVWVARQDPPGLLRLDPDSGEVSTEDIPSDAILFDGSLAIGEGAVWLTNPDSTDPEGETLLRIDPESGEVDGDPIRLPEGFDGNVAVGGGAVWVHSDSTGAVIRVDPDARQVVGRPIGGGDSGSGRVVVDYGSAWVSQGDGDTVTRLEY